MGCDPSGQQVVCGKEISIHASRMGCDIPVPRQFSSPVISIHASRMGCDFRVCMESQSRTISIHASRMGCDRSRFGCTSRLLISIHASRMGCDFQVLFQVLKLRLFQSTHPVWDATRLPYDHQPRHKTFQSTHPVWDATGISKQGLEKQEISIHASRMGCDDDDLSFFLQLPEFQSTHPVWDATVTAYYITAPSPYFNPRIPYGMRLGVSWSTVDKIEFQSTHPVWDATLFLFDV